MTAYPQVRSWAVSGHSLGGSMAAHFVKGNPAAVQGLVLWAAYPAGIDDLARQPIKVLSIYGTRDGLATAGKIESTKYLLPPDTQFVAVQGGVHAQFGWYGVQAGDGTPAISRREQQDQVVRVTVDFLSGLK